MSGKLYVNFCINQSCNTYLGSQVFSRLTRLSRISRLQSQDWPVVQRLINLFGRLNN